MGAPSNKPTDPSRTDAFDQFCSEIDHFGHAEAIWAKTILTHLSWQHLCWLFAAFWAVGWFQVGVAYFSYKCARACAYAHIFIICAAMILCIWGCQYVGLLNWYGFITHQFGLNKISYDYKSMPMCENFDVLWWMHKKWTRTHVYCIHTIYLTASSQRICDKGHENSKKQTARWSVKPLKLPCFLEQKNWTFQTAHEAVRQVPQEWIWGFRDQTCLYIWCVWSLPAYPSSKYVHRFAVIIYLAWFRASLAPQFRDKQLTFLSLSLALFVDWPVAWS